MLIITEKEFTDGQFLNTAEAAAFLGLATQTLHNWRFRGKGPPYSKLSSRAIRYCVGDLRNFQRSRRIDPEATR